MNSTEGSLLNLLEEKMSQGGVHLQALISRGVECQLLLGLAECSKPLQKK